MPSIFVCPKCKNVSETKTRCFSGTFCDRDDGEERVEYSPVTNAVPFSIGDNVLWRNKNDSTKNTVECLDIASQRAREYSNAAKVIEIVEGVIVSALKEDITIQSAFTLQNNQWCCGNTVLVRA